MLDIDISWPSVY